MVNAVALILVFGAVAMVLVLLVVGLFRIR